MQAIDREQKVDAIVAEFRVVSKSFGDTLATSELDLSVTRGEYLTFLCPAGFGKMTALKMTAGFEKPASGEKLTEG